MVKVNRDGRLIRSGYSKPAHRNKWGETKVQSTLSLTPTAKRYLHELCCDYALTGESDVVEVLARYAHSRFEDFELMLKLAKDSAEQQCKVEPAIPEQSEERVSRELGACVRSLVADSSILESRVVASMQEECPSLWMLILGRKVSGEQLLRDIPYMSRVLGRSQSELWKVCKQAMELPC